MKPNLKFFIKKKSPSQLNKQNQQSPQKPRATNCTFSLFHCTLSPHKTIPLSLAKTNRQQDLQRRGRNTLLLWHTRDGHTLDRSISAAFPRSHRYHGCQDLYVTPITQTAKHPLRPSLSPACRPPSLSLHLACTEASDDTGLKLSNTGDVSHGIESSQSWLPKHKMLLELLITLSSSSSSSPPSTSTIQPSNCH